MRLVKFTKLLKILLFVVYIFKIEIFIYSFVVGSVLSSVNADRNFTSGGAQLLVEPTVCPYPYVIFGNFHLIKINMSLSLFQWVIRKECGLTEVRNPDPGA